MTITVDIRPEVQAELACRAAQFSHKIPALSDKAFALERQYRDHD
jgi:hypothetical protein